jgi:hypothetical protein
MSINWTLVYAHQTTVRESGSRRLSDSLSFLLNIQKPTRLVGESFFDYEYLLEFEAKIGNGSKGSVGEL